MLPTFNAKGDILLVDKFFIRWQPLRRFDIVTAYSPHVDGQHVCKRVLAVPGQFVRLGSGEVFHVRLMAMFRSWLCVRGRACVCVCVGVRVPVPVAMIQGRVVARVCRRLVDCFDATL